MIGAKGVADRVHQMRLAEAGGRMEEQRAVARHARRGDRLRGIERQPVRIADDEPIEGQPRIEWIRCTGAGVGASTTGFNVTTEAARRVSQVSTVSPVKPGRQSRNAMRSRSA